MLASIRIVGNNRATVWQTLSRSPGSWDYTASVRRLSRQNDYAATVGGAVIKGNPPFGTPDQQQPLIAPARLITAFLPLFPPAPAPALLTTVFLPLFLDILSSTRIALSYFPTLYDSEAQ